MTTVTIAGEQKDLEAVTESWINKSINKPKSQGLQVCVRVQVREDGLNLNLSTLECGGGGGGGRPPNQKEQRVFTLWKQQGLNDSDFRSGNLVAFLKQLQSKYL